MSQAEHEAGHNVLVVEDDDDTRVMVEYRTVAGRHLAMMSDYDGAAQHYERALRAVLADPGFDAVIVIYTPPLVTQPEEIAAAQAAVEAARAQLTRLEEGARAIFQASPTRVVTDEANKVTGEVTIMGALKGQDQDAFEWTVSDVDAQKRWTIELEGLPEPARRYVRRIRREQEVVHEEHWGDHCRRNAILAEPLLDPSFRVEVANTGVVLGVGHRREHEMGHLGGVGSLPGVVLGSFVLVGLPELLREFTEYRYLMYGILLIIMMLVRPEGLLPEATRRRELHTGEDENFEPVPQAPIGSDN